MGSTFKRTFFVSTMVLLIFAIGCQKKPSITIHDAAKMGNIDELKIHIEYGSDINSLDAQGNAPLHIAVLNKQMEAIRILLENGAKIDIKNLHGHTPLAAAYIEDLPIAYKKILILKGANVNFRLSNNQTPLHREIGSTRPVYMDDGYTIADGLSRVHTNYAKLLISNGADIESRDKENRTPLYLAVQVNNLPIVTLLSDKGADMNAKGPGGLSPLLVSVLNNKPAMAKLLIEKGADINFQEKGKSLSALYIAAIENNIDMVNLLIENEADTELKTAKGSTPLYGAALHGRKETAKILIDMGADINTKDKEGIPLLHMALLKGKIEIARWLIEKGADINAKCMGLPLTPLKIAKDQKLYSIINLLETKGAEYKPIDTQQLSASVTTKEKPALMQIGNDPSIEPTNAGMVAYYPFDGNAEDKSTNQNHCSVQGATMGEDRFGRSNCAYYFDGTSGCIFNDSPVGLDFRRSNEVTFSAWFKFFKRNKSHGILGLNHKAYRMMMMNNGAMMNPLINAGNYSDHTVRGVNLEHNTWYHYCMTIRGGKQAIVYINGEPIYHVNSGLSSRLPDGTKLQIGAVEDKRHSPLSGAIDEVRIYNRALTKDEIQQLYR